jgi:phosphatidate phosphatase PAH1
MHNFKDALNNSSINSQSEKNEIFDFRFSLIIKDLQSLIFSAHPFFAGISEKIRDTLSKVVHTLTEFTLNDLLTASDFIRGDNLDR